MTRATSADEKIGNAVMTLIGCGGAVIVFSIAATVLAIMTIWKVWHG